MQPRLCQCLTVAWACDLTVKGTCSVQVLPCYDVSLCNAFRSSVPSSAHRRVENTRLENWRCENFRYLGFVLAIVALIEHPLMNSVFVYFRVAFLICPIQAPYFAIFYRYDIYGIQHAITTVTCQQLPLFSAWLSAVSRCGRHSPAEAKH